MERLRLPRKFAAGDEEMANALHASIEEAQELDPNQDKPVHFHDHFSGSSVKLPQMSAYPEDLQAMVRVALVDVDMEVDLKQQRVLNWFPKVQALLPILTPNDGNCLLHAISTAVWGVHDDFNTLRRTLNAEMVRDYQRKQTYFRRWSLHRKQQDHDIFGSSVQDSSALLREFEGVMKRASPQPISNTVVPHAFLEPIHIYVMANVLRRPIIVIADSSARTLYGSSLQESDMGGIYLPLEWQPGECRRVPVVLAFNLNHFSPLLAQEVLDRSRPAPMMAVPIQLSDLSVLPVKFAMAEEEPNITSMLKRYLILQEVPLTATGDGSLSLILVAMLDGQSPALDVVKPYFVNCQRQYQALRSGSSRSVAASASQWQPGSTAPSQPAPGVVPVQPRPRPEPAVPHPSNEAYYNAGEETRVTGAAPQPAAFEAVPVQSAGGLGLGGETQSMLFRGTKCTTPGCEFYASQATGMKCSKCLEKITIQEARRNPRQPAPLPIPPPPPAMQAQPSAPAPSVPLESPASMMSMMSQNCANRCGYRCSTKTYPYCHECADQIWSQLQAPPSAPQAPPSVPLAASPQRPPLVPLASPQAQVPAPPRLGQQQSEEDLFGAGGQGRARLGNLSLSPTSPPAPSTPPTPGSAQPFDRCSTPGCYSQGSQNCEGMCVGCYIRGSPTVRVAAGTGPRPQSQSSYNSEVAQALGGAALPTGTSPHAFTATPLSPAKGPAPGQTATPTDPSLSKTLCTTAGCQGQRGENEYGMCQPCYRKNLPPMAGGMESQGQGLSDMSLEQRPPEMQDLIESGNSDFCGHRKTPSPSSSHGKQPKRRKCAGPACSVMLYSRDLCDQCMAVLQQHRATQGGRDLPQRQISAPAPNTAPPPQVKKAGQCVTPNCTFFGAPKLGGYCSSCAKKGVMSNLSAPIMRNHPVEVVPVRSNTAPVAKGQPCIVEGCTRFGDPSNDDMCTKCWHYNRQRVMQQQARDIRHRPVQVSLDPGMDQTHSFPPYGFSSQGPLVPSPSRSPSEEESFSLLNRLEDRSRSTRRCKQRNFACPNFGNSQNAGLCNSCFRARQQELLCLEQHG